MSCQGKGCLPQPRLWLSIDALCGALSAELARILLHLEHLECSQ